MHRVCVASDSNLLIGCEEHTIHEWESLYKSIGAKHGYSDQQVEEYAMYIEMAKKWMSIHNQTKQT